MKKLLTLAVWGACLAMDAGTALAQFKGNLEVENLWARATPPGAAVGAGYLTIRNKGTVVDRLVGATSPASARVEIHEMAMERDIMRMREIKGVDVPAKGVVEFKPGGFHLMFMELKGPLKHGEKVPVTLRFEKSGEIRADFAVEAAGAGGTHSAKHGAMKH